MSEPPGVMPRRKRLADDCSETSGLFKTPDISEQWDDRGRTRSNPWATPVEQLRLGRQLLRSHRGQRLPGQPLGPSKVARAEGNEHRQLYSPTPFENHERWFR